MSLSSGLGHTLPSRTVTRTYSALTFQLGGEEVEDAGHKRSVAEGEDERVDYRQVQVDAPPIRAPRRQQVPHLLHSVACRFDIIIRRSSATC